MIRTERLMVRVPVMADLPAFHDVMWRPEAMIYLSIPTLPRLSAGRLFMWRATLRSRWILRRSIGAA